jgi:hypothetical protein
MVCVASATDEGSGTRLVLAKCGRSKSLDPIDNYVAGGNHDDVSHLQN